MVVGAFEGGGGGGGGGGLVVGDVGEQGTAGVFEVDWALRGEVGDSGVVADHLVCHLEQHWEETAL